MHWKLAAELFAVAPFAALFLAAFAVETARIVAAVRTERGQK